MEILRFVEKIIKLILIKITLKARKNFALGDLPFGMPATQDGCKNSTLTPGGGKEGIDKTPDLIAVPLDIPDNLPGHPAVGRDDDRFGELDGVKDIAGKPAVFVPGDAQTRAAQLSGKFPLKIVEETAGGLFFLIVGNRHQNHLPLIMPDQP